MQCFHSVGAHLYDRPFAALPKKPHCLRFWSTMCQALKDHLDVHCLGNLYLFVKISQQFQAVQFAQNDQWARIADNHSIAAQFNSSASVCWLKGGSIPLA